jgi:hypothetical protein
LTEIYLPDLWQRVLVNGNLGVDSGARVAIPMPDSTNIGAGFHDFALETLLTKLVHQVDSTESSTHDQHIGLELFGIVFVVRDRRLVGRTNICSRVSNASDTAHPGNSPVLKWTILSKFAFQVSKNARR